jgi:hypothetical protein
LQTAIAFKHRFFTSSEHSLRLWKKKLIQNFQKGQPS